MSTRNTFVRLAVTGALSSIFLTATAQAADTREPQLADKVLQAAFAWNEKGFREGQAEQCMNWTREVLSQACGEKFRSLKTDTPWDLEFLYAGETIEPLHADSLASAEFGTRINSVEETIAGDLIFLKNTYGNWKEGVITHVGIATGDGMYIHRMTSNQGIVKVQAIPGPEFSGAIRLHEELCE